MSLLRGPFRRWLRREAWNATSPTHCGLATATQASLPSGVMLTTMAGRKHALVHVSIDAPLALLDRPCNGFCGVAPARFSAADGGLVFDDGVAAGASLARCEQQTCARAMDAIRITATPHPL